MKHSIEWHEDCAANFRMSLDHEMEVLLRQQKRVAKMQMEYEISLAQIKEAKAEITASMNQRAYGLIDRKQQLLSVIREMDEALARVQAKFLGATSANEYEAKYLQTSDSGIFNVITAARSKAAEVVGE